MALRVSRRQFLVGTTSALFLAGCGIPDRIAGREQVRYTMDGLLQETPFLVAHRGSGDNWPEHTATAYLQSAAAGAKAIEVSVCSTKDGVLVCHHDINVKRTTGKDLRIADTTYAELEGLRVDARKWLGPGAAPEPIPRLQDVLDELGKSHVLFIEDKQGTNTEALLALMGSYPESQDRLVWKQRAERSEQHAAAARGYRTWGYFEEPAFDRIAELAPRYDLLGITSEAPDDVVAEVVAQGRPVIAWPIHTRWMRDRMLRLGATGLMCSNYPYVATDAALRTSDEFSSGMRAPGDLPGLVDSGWAAQPRIEPDIAAVTLNDTSSPSYCMGSLCPLPGEAYSLELEMRWPDELPPDGSHAGIAFGQADDSEYRVHVPSTVGGYHVVIRPSGQMDLYRRPPGRAAGALLDSAKTDPPKAGKWMRLRVDVTGYSVEVTRMDGSGRRVTAYDRTYRGGYFTLNRNYPKGPDVQFRSIVVN